MYKCHSEMRKYKLSEELREVIQKSASTKHPDKMKMAQVHGIIVNAFEEYVDQPILIGELYEPNGNSVWNGMKWSNYGFMIRKGKKLNLTERETGIGSCDRNFFYFLDFPIQTSLPVPVWPWPGEEAKPFRLSWHKSTDPYINIYSEEGRLNARDIQGLEIILGRDEIERRLFYFQQSMDEYQISTLFGGYLEEMEKIGLEPTQEAREIVAKYRFGKCFKYDDNGWSSLLFGDLEGNLEMGLHKGDYTIEVSPGIIVHPPRLLREAAKKMDSWKSSIDGKRTNLIATYFTK